MRRERSKDPVTAAITSYLWPYLRGAGFAKSTSRNFAKEVNGFFLQIWIDAGGFSGKESVRVYYNIMPNAEDNVRSYSVGESYDSFDMSTHERADSAMQNVVKLLNDDFLPYLESLANYAAYIKQFTDFGAGIESYKQEMLIKLEKWKCNNFSEADKIKISENRIQLKL